VKLAEKRAKLLETDAGFAIDYAIASVEQARLAVLDAIDGRLAAEQAKRAHKSGSKLGDWPDASNQDMMGNIQAIEVQIPEQPDAWRGGGTMRIAPGQYPQPGTVRI
jgi:hypothetical protein